MTMCCSALFLRKRILNPYQFMIMASRPCASYVGCNPAMVAVAASAADATASHVLLSDGVLLDVAAIPLNPLAHVIFLHLQTDNGVLRFPFSFPRPTAPVAIKVCKNQPPSQRAVLGQQRCCR
jgi:hypothetical protein